MKVVRKARISKDAILSKITPYDVYRRYFGDFQLNRKYLNHLRGDRKQPSFEIVAKYGELSHMDYGDDYWRGDCINLVEQLYRCDFLTALKTVDRDFNLGLASEVIENTSPIITWTQPKVIEKKMSVIQAVTRKFTKDDYRYWGEYELGEEELKSNVGGVQIFSIKEYYLNKTKQSVDALTFGYLFDGKHWKIYKPENQENKWVSSVAITHMYGLGNIQKCENSFTMKSVKDYKVWMKFISTCTCGVQNESKVAISDENIRWISENSRNRYICFDADATGVSNCTWYNSKGFNYWNVPKRYYEKYNVKDPSDFVKRYGGERLYKEVRKKILC